MTGNEFQKHVLRTANNGLTDNEELSNICMGMAGETGEFVDMIKKHIFHKHELDLMKCATELGDQMFYIAWAADVLGFDLETIMKMNKEKLDKRYPNGFNPHDSISREDD